MPDRMKNLRFAVKALPAEQAPPRELSRSMSPHPLMYQELPYDPEYSLYNDRLTPEKLNNATADEMYWKVRREVILRPLRSVVPTPNAQPYLHARHFQVEDRSMQLSIRLLP